MTAIDLITPAVVPILPAVHSLLVLLMLMGSGLLAGVWALRHPRAWAALLRFVWSQKWSLLSLAAVLWIATALVGRVRNDRGAPHSDQPSVVADAHWSARGNARRTGSTAGAVVPRRGAIQSVGGVGYTFYSSGAVAGGRVYAVGFSGDRSRIFCWDARNGRALWTRAVPGMRATFSSPVIDGTRLLVGEGLHHTPDASLFVIDIGEGREGDLLGRFTTTSHVEGTPVVVDGRVFFTAGDDGVYALDLPAQSSRPAAVQDERKTLRVRWHLPGTQVPDVETAICHYDGKLYVGSGQGGEALVAIDAASGREVGRIDFPHPVHGLPAVSNGRLYVGMGTADYVDYRASRGQVSCIDLATFRVLWSVPLEGTLLGSAACDDTGIVFGCTDGQVYAVDPDGRVQAKWDSRAAILASVALADETVLVVNEAGVLYALTRHDLQPLWQTRLGGPGAYFSAPVVSDGRVWVGTPDAGSLCIGDAAGSLDSHDSAHSLPERGTILWRHQTDGRITASPGASDTVILLATQTDAGPVLTGLRQSGEAPPEVVWRRNLDGPVEYPILTSGEIAIVALPSELLALDAPTGMVLWRTTATTQSVPIFDGERVWIDVGRDGDPAWRALSFADAQPVSVGSAADPPAISRPEIVWHVAGSVLNLQRGGETSPGIWCDLSEIGPVVGEPVVAGATAYVVVADGELVALGRPEEP